MEADISIWQKPGHFYFALTRMENGCGVLALRRDDAASFAAGTRKLRGKDGAKGVAIRACFLCRGPSAPIQPGPQDKLKPRSTKIAIARNN